MRRCLDLTVDGGTSLVMRGQRPDKRHLTGITAYGSIIPSGDRVVRVHPLTHADSVSGLSRQSEIQPGLE